MSREIQSIAMNTDCPGVQQCPIFSGVLKDKSMTAKSYQRLFCSAGEERWITCKRFMTKQRFGKCPSDLLPNSSLSIEQIAVKYNLL